MVNQLMPEPFKPVVAEIYINGELGLSKWYEVVYHNGENWESFAGSKTFDDGETVIKWVYAKDILFNNIRPDLD
jgi:hypothetical protein